MRPFLRNSAASPNSTGTMGFGFRAGWLIGPNYRLNLTYESAMGTLQDEVFGSIHSNFHSLAAFTQVLFSLVPNQRIDGYVGGGLGYHRLSFAGEKLKGEHSANLAMQFALGTEYRVATHWSLLMETGYQHVFIEENNIDPANLRIFAGLGYLRANR